MTMTPTTAGLAVINEGMTWEDRIEARVENINICCDTVQQSILFFCSVGRLQVVRRIHHRSGLA